MVDVGVGERDFFGSTLLDPFLGNDNNFMTHDECEAMCDDLIQDQKPSTSDRFALCLLTRNDRSF